MNTFGSRKIVVFATVYDKTQEFPDALVDGDHCSPFALSFGCWPFFEDAEGQSCSDAQTPLFRLYKDDEMSPSCAHIAYE